MKVKTIRAYWAAGQLYEIGRVVEWSPQFATELVHAGKAERVVEAGADVAPASSAVLTTETAGDLVKGKAPAKGKS